MVLNLAACAGRPETAVPVTVGGLEIHNQTGAWVAAVRLLVPDTGRFVSCGNIAPGASCATAFPGQAYTGQGLEVTWSQAGQIFSTGTLHLVPDEALVQAGTAQLLVVLSGPGTAAAMLVETP